ncbi:MAG: hypothetical protein ACLUOI_16705 [Eisenbergiella sp.]
MKIWENSCRKRRCWEDQRILGLFETIRSSRQDITNIGIIDDRNLHVLINDSNDA